MEIVGKITKDGRGEGQRENTSEVTAEILVNLGDRSNGRKSLGWPWSGGSSLKVSS
jgi:hypothetical protein